ncbi:MAG: hypothetical protein DRP01_00935 [Archaeoglobales archaeon]|nr:MAG: hypothetical protein DRP01_00935 [Archaeoglobales archaeon]
MGLTLDELKKRVYEEAEKIDDWKLYIHLRRLKIRRLTPNLRTFHILKVLIAMRRLHLPINSNTVTWIFPNEHNLFNKLHNLGDKHLIILKRKERTYEWILNEELLGDFL